MKALAQRHHQHLKFIFQDPLHNSNLFVINITYSIYENIVNIMQKNDIIKSVKKFIWEWNDLCHQFLWNEETLNFKIQQYFISLLIIMKN